MRMEEMRPWGNYPVARQVVQRPFWLDEGVWPVDRGLRGTVLPYGLGRSYGDVCLNDGGAAIVTSGLSRIQHFDRERGIIRCESGASLHEILQVVIPAGWFLPVTPGTQYVTVGGAVANDVHGKNHHTAGTFGSHVQALELWRSNGERIRCGPDEEHAVFRATVGGLGLTGFIAWVELKLTPCAGPWCQVEQVKFESLEEFFELSGDSDAKFPYTVAWLDCVGRDKNFGRGIFMRGDFVSDGPARKAATFGSGPVVPFFAPGGLLNRTTVTAFNSLYYGRLRQKVTHQRQWYQSFFYPLDSVRLWNRMYGRKGFFQFQCVLPPEQKATGLRELLSRISASGWASFLAVLKEFGDVRSPGLLSFPRPGVTLCLDFPNRGADTVRFMKDLEEFVVKCGGALYPAKDALMSAATFLHSYPRVTEFEEFRDPGFSSSFWRRVRGQ